MMEKKKGASSLGFGKMVKAWVEEVKQRERRERKGGHSERLGLEILELEKRELERKEEEKKERKPNPS